MNKGGKWKKRKTGKGKREKENGKSACYCAWAITLQEFWCCAQLCWHFVCTLHSCALSTDVLARGALAQVSRETQWWNRDPRHTELSSSTLPPTQHYPPPHPMTHAHSDTHRHTQQLTSQVWKLSVQMGGGRKSDQSIVTP